MTLLHPHHTEEDMFRQHAIRCLPMAALLLPALLLAGCGGEPNDPLAPQDGVPQASRIDGDRMVPLEWTYHAWAVAAPSVPCLLPDGSTVINHVAPTYAISGHLSHLGRLDPDASVANILTCNVIMGPAGPEGVTGDVTAHLVGPQGDAVDLAGTLTLVFAAGHSVGDWDVMGGAGRFVGAGGHIDTLEAPNPDGTGSLGSGSGMITLPSPVKGGR
jgi:hypothetical protein